MIAIPSNTKIIGPGVAVQRRKVGGEFMWVAIVQGGYRDNCDVKAVVASARKVLESFPHHIGRVEVVVADRDLTTSTAKESAAQRAEAKRARRAAKMKSDLDPERIAAERARRAALKVVR